MKKRCGKNSVLLAVLLLAMALTACGGKDEKDNAAVSALKDKLAKQQEDTKDQSGDVQQEEETPSNIISIDFKSEEEILAFLAGEWAFLDRETGEDFATITFHEDGTLQFTRSDERSSPGSICFEERYAAQEGMPYQFRLTLNEVKNVVPEDVAEYADDVDETSGTFHIGCGVDTDYLYLTEIGNGDSMISCYVFNTHPGEAYFDVPTWANEWMLYRKNNGYGAIEPKKNADFYAFAWQRNEDGSVLLQEMEPYEFDTFEEYTERAFTAAYFQETDDICVQNYPMSDRIDTTQLYDEQCWNDPYPLGIFSVQTDDSGTVVSVRDVDESYYGIYDMGALDPEFSVDDKNFYYNHASFAMEEFAPGATAVMDCERVGNWIIVDCHVNPHVGLYEFFNINNGYFQYEINGANLIWQGDDLSTAVYSRFGEVYDFWGNLIGSVGDGEVAGLSFKTPDTIVVEYWKNGSGSMDTEQTELEYEPVDSQLLLYYDYLLSGHKPSQWRTFMSSAPKDAKAYVIINAPEMIADWLPAPSSTEGGLDVMTVISLYDGETIHIDSGNVDASGKEVNYMDFQAQNRSDAVAYSLTVPEGMPVETLVVRMKDGKEITWPIWTISGRAPERTIFIPAE